MTTQSNWENFTEEELNCSCCGKANPDSDGGEWSYLMNVVQSMRSELDFPFPVTSGYRCPNHPIEAGKVARGKPVGYHTKAAVDIGVNRLQAIQLLNLAFSFGFTGIGINQKGDDEDRFIHLDFRESPTIWSY
jgi:uncharacterized protein YcbK (DUF882 family)